MAVSLRSVLFALPPLNTALVLVVSAICYFLAVLYQKRRELKGLPQPPMPWPILGHIPVAADCEAHFPAGVHPHVFAHHIRKKYNLGKVFYVDFWPLGPRSIFVADPELASQYVTTGQSLPKSPLANEFLHRLLGRNNMVSLEGEQWKSLRSMFNPGFASGHLMTLVPYIVDQSLVFCDVLRECAESGDLIELEELATRLTVDIIGKVVLDSDFNSQRSDNAIVTTFRRQIALMPTTSINPFNGLDPLRNLKVFFNGRKLDRLLGEEIDRKFSALKAKTSNGNVPEKASRKDRNRSVIALALEAYSKNTGGPSSSASSSKPLSIDAAFRQMSIDSVKTFIFAGHDTTSSTVAFLFYLLAQHTEVLSKVLAELTSVFATLDSLSIASQMRAHPHLVNNLPYAAAVIKETLRLFPPASTLRDVSSAPKSINRSITDPDTGEVYPLLDGWVAWPVAHLIHRNEAYFPKPMEFIPERFLDDKEAEEGTPFDKKASDLAWRPFERGPRNCIGQELAMLETKIILAMTVGTFAFQPEIDGWVVKEKEVACETVDEKETVNVSAKDVKGRDEKAQKGTTRNTVEGKRCYQILKVSAKPVGGMPGRVFMRT